MFNHKVHKPIVLVVDDVAENIDILKGALIADYVIRPAPSGQVALHAARIRPCPDLILLDIMMPNMDGYEVCRRLKADPVTKDIPVIFVTAKTEVWDELAGLQIGAVDYITKPFSIPIVQARVKTHLALRAATQKLEGHNQNLLHERGMIESIVLKMRQADTFIPRYLRQLVSPVEVTAGDMLLAAFTPDGRQMVLLGDFTGHGLSAAIGGPLVTYIFYHLVASGDTGEQLLTEINDQLCQRLPTGIFFAASLLEIAADRTGGTLWNASLPELLLRRNNAIHARFSSTMFPLGISRTLDVPGKATHLVLEPGDRIYAFSDGIIESRDAQNNMFGMERLEAFLSRVGTGDHDLAELTVLLAQHVGSSEQEDDITLVEMTV